MEKEVGISSCYTILAGIFFLIEGAWGIFSPMVFGVFSSNHLHATVHLALGVIGIYAGYMDRPFTYCLLVGLLLLTVGVLRLVSGTADAIVHLLNVNHAVAYANICIGILSLIMCMFVKPPPLD